MKCVPKLRAFRSVAVKALVATGSITTVDLRLQLGEQKETVTVDEVTPQIETERHNIDQVISRRQILDLPLNARSFLQLAFLAPGVQISNNYQGDYNSHGAGVPGLSGAIVKVAADDEKA